MSFGRPDYNIKVVPTVNRLGDDEEKYSYHEQLVSILNGQLKNIQITVPDDYDYFITDIVVSVNTPIQHYLQVDIGTNIIFSGYFDSTYHVYGTGNSFIVAEGGTIITIYWQNKETSGVESDCQVTLNGYKQQLSI